MLTRFFGFGRRSFASLSEQEILALAISSEEDDGRIYRAYADGLRENFPHSSAVFDEMADEEVRQRFGERIPLIRCEHVRGYYERRPDWLVRPLGLERVRAQAEIMERQGQRFYLEAAKRTFDAGTRKLLGENEWSMEEAMPSNSARSLYVALALTAGAVLPAAARANETLFKGRCAECHSRAQSLARGLPGKSPEEKSALLAKFLETHHAPAPEERAALVSYLVGLANR